MKGKDKCKALKEIRRQIAEKNDIEYVVSECSFQGECKGTCPKCEEELRYLERQLEIRKSVGKAVAVVGISTGVCTSLTACSPVQTLEDIASSALEKLGIIERTTGVLPAPEELTGDMEFVPLETITPAPTTTHGSEEAILMGEMPVDTPVPDTLEAGEVWPQVTLLPEIVEGDIAIIETSVPDMIDGYLFEENAAKSQEE